MGGGTVVVLNVTRNLVELKSSLFAGIMMPSMVYMSHG